FIEPLCLLLQTAAGMPQQTTHSSELSLQLSESCTPQPIEPLLPIAQQLPVLGLMRTEELGCGRRRRGTYVGHEVGNGEVHFVSNCAPHGNFRSRDRTRQGLVVEAPQILERSATTRQQDHVHIGKTAFSAIDELHRCFQFRGRSLPLHLYWND